MSPKKGVSLGTVLMIVLTVFVLAGCCFLYSTVTGHTGIQLNASELIVALDQSVSGLSAAMHQEKTTTAVPAVSVRTTLAPSATAVQTTTRESRKYRFSFCAAGSVTFDTKVQKYFDNLSYEYITSNVDNLASADLSILTFENTVISGNKSTSENLKNADALAAFRTMGFNTVCLGTPSMLSGGLAGAAETQNAAASAGFSTYGIALSQAESSQFTILDVNGIKIGLLHYQTEISSSSKKQTTEEERSFALHMLDADTMMADIAAIKAQGANLVLVSLSWGKEGASAPTDDQRKVAQQLADAGVDILIGTHSGVLQEIEILSANRGDGSYHPVLCAYSLGALFSSNRDTALNLGSLLLKSEIVYDASTDCVAFETLTAIPVYTARGKVEKKTFCCILRNDGVTYPAFLESSQPATMKKCLSRAQELLSGSGITLEP